MVGLINIREFRIIKSQKYHREIHETNAAIPTKALYLHEEHHVQKHARNEFHEAVIRDHIRETAGQILTLYKKVVMLEIGK